MNIFRDPVPGVVPSIDRSRYLITDIPITSRSEQRPEKG